MELKVKDVMDSQPLMINSNDNIARAVALLRQEPGLVVCNVGDSAPVGIVTSGILCSYLLMGGHADEPVTAVMQRLFAVVNYEDSVLKCDKSQKIWPVVEEGRLVGTVSCNRVELLAHEMVKAIQLNKELDSILEACSEGLYICDGKGMGLRVNKILERIIGLTPEDLVSKSISHVAIEGLISKSVSMEVIENKRQVTITQRYPNGKVCLVTGIPILDEEGNIFRIVTTIRDVTELHEVQRKLVEADRRSQKYYQELKKSRECVAASKAMNDVLDIASQIAKFDSTCLLLGESGVGKDVVAHFMHDHSPRQKGPFVKLNCAAIPHGLL